MLATYGYNTKGQLATVTTGNGVVTTYTYDELKHVTAISAASGATVL
ncbi:MAG: RHS repeat protein [Terrimicrobiaceae bacterium]|nr:RHS repeat protein [Terrimicrobiaceae bacterium]